MHGLQAHSCAVLSSGAVSCWGWNGYGQVSALADLRGVVCVRGEMLFVLTSGVLCRLVTVHLAPIDSRPSLLLVWVAALRTLL